MRDRIDTERITLRRPRLSDAADMAAWINDYEVAKQTATICHPYSYLHAEFWVMACPSFWARGLAYNFVIEKGGAVIGSIGLSRGSAETEFEIGYMLGADHWGQGLMSHAVRALMAAAREDLGLPRLHAGVFTDNPDSAALLLKIGFERTGEDSVFSMARGCTAHGHRYVCDMDAFVSVASA